MIMKYGLAVVLGLAMTRMALADTTALDLVKKGNDYVGVQSKDKIIQISSEKSVASLEPNVWHIVYFDPDQTFKTTDVKFGAGEEMAVSHGPLAFPPMPAKLDQVVDLSKVNVDSDKALDIAKSQPLLKGLTLRSSKMTLQSGDYGVVWKVEFWAAKVANPTKTAGVGSVWVSAKDGSVVKSDLHPDSVN